ILRIGVRVQLRPLGRHVQPPVGGESALERAAQGDLLGAIARAGEAHQPTTRAPVGGTRLIQGSDARPWRANACVMAAQTASACGSRLHANTVGPAPEIEQPIAPAASATWRTSAKP